MYKYHSTNDYNMEVSDTGIETTEFNDCIEVLGDDRDANGVLAMIWEKVRFFHKNE